MKKKLIIFTSLVDDGKNKVNLLLLEKKHHVYIKDLDSLLNYSSSESESESKS